LSPRERTSTFDLLVVGEINADLLLYGDVTPEFGQAEKLVKDAVLTLGGSSAIVAHGQRILACASPSLARSARILSVSRWCACSLKPG
jgi:hypothetical protein